MKTAASEYLPRRSILQFTVWIEIALLLTVGVLVGAPRRAAAQEGAPVTGSYECYAYSGGRLVPRGGLNFTVTGPGRYADVEGTPGSYAYDVGSQVLTFVDGALDGQRAQYDGRANPQTITFLNDQRELGDSCDHQP